jgi:hypothetical protein
MLLTARLKVIVVLDANEVLAFGVPNGQARVKLRIMIGGRQVTADVAAKGLRKAQSTLRQSSAENVAVIVQGRLAADDSIEGAGLVAQIKTPKEGALPRDQQPMTRPFLDAPRRNLANE